MKITYYDIVGLSWKKLCKQDYFDFLRRKTPVPYFQKSAHLPLSPPLPAALTAAGGSGRAGEIPPYPAARTLPPSYFSLFSIHSRILRYPHTALILVFCPSYYSKLKTKKIHPIWWSLEDWIHNCIREQIKQKHFSNLVSFVNFEMEFLL